MCTPDSAYTTAIEYQQLPLSELEDMGREAAWALLTEKHPDVKRAAQLRFINVRVEMERRRRRGR